MDCRGLSLVFATLVLQTVWRPASSLLGPRTTVTKFINLSKVNKNEYCHTCIKIDNVCYNQSELFDLPAPFGEDPVVKRMRIMKATNVLYYTFVPAFSDKEYSKVGYVSLHATDYSGIISGWNYTFNFGPFDINQNKKSVYLGGSDGIWYINSVSRLPAFYSMSSERITNIFVKDYVYFTAAERTGIYHYLPKFGYYLTNLSGKKIDNFVLDNMYNIVYLIDTGLFISFSDKSHDDVRLSLDRFFRGLTVDGKGVAYAWHIDGIYKVYLSEDLSQSTLKRVSNIAPDAMTFDQSNNILYSIGKTLYKLTKVDTADCFGM
ncbi:uncharacterized protein LOC125235934 [Leguminivora glycinivorella]|uniref:uncharacterized protein LOC125235934 n=1 Tax=Leguminivora glycinivorella TaxID=1035111 RepID=UPI00200BB0EF|nr:uncharacterized protein LOC125235934 [Leguminivora glycinivorella]